MAIFNAHIYLVETLCQQVLKQSADYVSLTHFQILLIYPISGHIIWDMKTLFKHLVENMRLC